MAFDQRPPPSEGVEAALAKARSLINWINERLQGLELSGDHRHRIPAQLFDLALEHQAAIAELLALKLYASGFALVRCEFECFIRGAWLHHCATDEQLQTFIDQDRLPRSIGAMIEDLEKAKSFGGDFLSHVKDSAWEAMNGYTHGGIHQICRRMQGKYIEPSFEDAALLEVTNFSSAMALVALGQIAELADRKDLWDAAQAKIDEL